MARQAPVVQHLAVRAVHGPRGLEVHDLGAARRRGHAKRPAPRLRGFAGERQAIVLHQFAGVARRAVALQVFGRGHAQAPVVGHAHAHQRRVGQVAHAHGAVKALGCQVHHTVAEVERERHCGLLGQEPGHQGRHVAAPKACRGRDAQMAVGPHAPGRHAGLGIGHVGQQALAVFEEGGAFVREADAPRGAHQELDAQVLLQCIEPPPHDGRRHALGARCCRQAAARGHRHERLEGLELVHGGNYRDKVCPHAAEPPRCRWPEFSSQISVHRPSIKRQQL